MPGFVLNMASIVMCAHGGQAKATAPAPRVMVGGQPAVLQNVPYAVAGCGLTTSPCTVANWLVGALRVRSNGIPLLLQDSQAICPSSGGTLLVAQTQPRVRGQ
jgi:hypothetical protein